MNKLKTNYLTVSEEKFVVGNQAGLMRDSINGDTLVIQSGVTQLIIKLSDLLEFVNEQNKPIEEVKADNAETN